jgi:hypothetical protein
MGLEEGKAMAMTLPAPGYSHTQRAPLCLVLYGTAACLLASARLAPGQPAAAPVVAVAGGLTA